MIIFACIKNHLHIRWLLERELFKIINLIEYVIIVHRQNSHKWKSSDKSRRLNWPTEMNKKTNKIILTRAYNSHHFSLSLSRMVLWTKASKFNRSSNQDGSHIHQEQQLQRHQHSITTKTNWSRREKKSLQQMCVSNDRASKQANGRCTRAWFAIKQKRNK